MRWVLAVLLLGIIVLIHELGHFIAAKLCGVAVLEFQIGFGPRLVSYEKGETRYSLKALPFGGACVMKGEIPSEDGTIENAGDPDTFQMKSLGRRASILFAGPFANFLLAFLGAVVLISAAGYDPTTVTRVGEESNAYEAGLRTGDEILSINGKRMVIGRDVENYFSFRKLEANELMTLVIRRNGERQTIAYEADTQERYMLGIRYFSDNEEAALTDVEKGSASEEAGMRAGDVITALNGEPIASGAELSAYISEHELGTESLRVVFKRNGHSYETAVTPVMTVYVTPGFGCYAPREKTSAVGVLRYSVSEVRFWISTVIRSLGMLFGGKAGVQDLSGPVGVVEIISDAYEESAPQGAVVVMLNLLYLVVLLSANLGVMNLLPIPALDGGRLVLLAAEAVLGHKVNARVEGMLNFVSMALLMLLMAVVMFNDILRLF